MIIMELYLRVLNNLLIQIRPSKFYVTFNYKGQKEINRPTALEDVPRNIPAT
jgi:hypothetical protein